MLFTGSGRHRRQSQAEKAAERAIAAAGVAGIGIALPLLAATGAHAAPSAVWDRVADCESGGDWSHDGGNGLYGGLQINAQRWTDYGGTQYAPLPSTATRSQQIAVAERILATEGPAAWLSCADDAGLSVVSAPGVVDDNDSADETGSLRGARGAAAVNASADGTVATKSGAPVFSGLPGYDPVYQVYWYEKNGGWFWTSHQSLYERYVQLTNPQPPAATAAPSPTAPDASASPTAPVSPVTPVVPVLPGDPTASPSPSPSTPGGDQTGNNGNGGTTGNGNGNNGNGNGNGGNGADSGLVITLPAPDASATAPAPTTTPAPEASATAPAATAEPSAAATTPAAEYTVGPGDTLIGIARSHGLDGDWSGIYQSNQQVLGENPDLIHPGQVLNLG
ncbi:transglycosylase family protein [Streptomyces sp. TLI_171]|uniref:LysM peptidoglycan-binding domain-containing protein n=1 Tax=Streptomyces sp. TLI_171 TaxID=1938859 RepID=UPI000C6847EF|nr:transglycosylase family protein [Streptomyces sp. TLI_171]RKE17152.1 LysM domain-containing protein [Streptomyces sp. TLI_171]